MLNRLPPGRLKRTLVITCALALTAQGLAQAAIAMIKLAKELLPLVHW